MFRVSQIRNEPPRHLCVSASFRPQILLWVTSNVNYLTRHIYSGLICDDRNFGGPKIWRNWTKTVTFRTSQKIRVFFIILFCDTKEIHNFLKFGKIMFKLLKQNENHKSISSSSSKGLASLLQFHAVLQCTPRVRFSDKLSHLIHNVSEAFKHWKLVST